MMDIFKGLILSFYSRDFYYDVARKWRGIGMGFILLLSLITILIAIFNISLSGSSFRQMINFVPEVAQKLPMIIIKDGKVSIDRPVPYGINFESPAGRDVFQPVSVAVAGKTTKPSGVWAVIDTNYKIHEMSNLRSYMAQNGIFMLLTETQIVTFDENKSKVEVTNLKETQSLTITHDNWHSLAEFVVHWGMIALLIFIGVFGFIAAFITNFIIVLAMGLVVMLLSMVLGAHLDYAAAMRVTAAIHIPIAAIEFLPSLAGGAMIGGRYAFALWVLYMLFAAWSSRHKVGSLA